MAANNKKENGKSANVFLIGGIALVVFVAYSMFLGYRLYSQLTGTYNNIQRSLVDVSTIKDNLLTVNRDVLLIIADPNKNAVDNVHEISNCFVDIERCMDDYEQVEDRDEKELRRYKQAKTFINAYHTKILSFQEMYMSGADRDESLKLDPERAKLLYTQELQPLQVTAMEMFDAAKDIGQENSEQQIRDVYQVLNLFMALMMVALVGGEAAIIIISRIAKAQSAKLDKREKELEAFDSKLKVSKRKMNEMAVMNILTGMKNRYALDSDVSDRLETGRFNIAVFDMDNFRSINDTYGYDFGDEYLAAVAEKLKDEFGDVAEIYNITGNEFCFLFNSSVTESQAMGIAQNIQRVMSSPYEVLNLAVQLPCSGAVYHYLPGDCLNVNSLLVKLDTALRTVKMNGGNMINTVMNM